MSGVLNRLRKKRGYPVEIEGETYHVRSLTLGELRRLEPLAAELKTGFVLGCALCSDAEGGQELPANDGEADAAWADRIGNELSDIPTQTIRELTESIAKVGTSPRVESIIKN